MACMLIIMGSCGITSTLSKNTINTLKLSPEQQEIVDLLRTANSTSEIYMFEYNTKETYRKVEFWVEAYENGELIERPAYVEMVSDNSAKRNGRLVAIITKIPHYQWALSLVENESFSNHVSTVEITVDEPMAGISGPVNTLPINIEDGKEIVLHKTLFNRNSVNDYDWQEHPELIKEYLYAHLIKCKFTK